MKSKQHKGMQGSKFFPLVIALFLLVTGCFSYVQIRNQQRERLIKGYRDSLDDILAYMDINLNGVERTLLAIGKTPIVVEVLNGEYENYIQAQNDLGEYVEVYFWYLVTSRNSAIDQLHIYTFRDIPNIGHFIQGAKLAQQRPWYKQMQRDKKKIFYTKDNALYLAYPVFYPNVFHMIGVVEARINTDNLVKILSESEGTKGWQLSLKGTVLAKNSLYQNGIQLQNETKDGLALTYFINDEPVQNGTLYILMLLFTSCMFLIGIFLYYNHRMMKDQQMILEEKKKQEYLRATVLKAQINPHFLYNMMSMINWKAMYSGQTEISQACIALSNFYRTALNHGMDEISVAEELSNVESYLKLKQMISETPFAYQIACPEELKEVKIINFILQPIVENALIHGISPKEQDGLIEIHVQAHEKGLLLQVFDNGDSDVIDQELFFQKGKGYGTRNVDERIKLKYGEEYGMTIERLDGRTCVTLLVGKK